MVFTIPKIQCNSAEIRAELLHFMCQLTAEKKNEVVANCDHLSNLKFSPALPYAFTEHGAIMAASVLNSERAIETSVFVVRAFVRLRQMLASHKDLERRLDALEGRYDEQFKVVFDAIRALMKPPEKPKKKIGFEVKEGKSAYGKKKIVIPDLRQRCSS